MGSPDELCVIDADVVTVDKPIKDQLISSLKENYREADDGTVTAEELIQYLKIKAARFSQKPGIDLRIVRVLVQEAFHRAIPVDLPWTADDRSDSGGQEPHLYPCLHLLVAFLHNLVNCCQSHDRKHMVWT